MSPARRHPGRRSDTGCSSAARSTTTAGWIHRPIGFNTPTRKVELYSQTLLEGGYAPVAEFEEPRVSPVSRPDLAARYPLILTSTKHHLFCETQHRGLPSLRRKAMDPELEIHPATAAERGIAAGDWVHLDTPLGTVRARARLNDTLRPDVVVGQHGWWQGCPELGAPGYDPFGPDGANLNLIIGNEAVDPISGSVPHRAYVAQVRRVEASARTGAGETSVPAHPQGDVPGSGMKEVAGPPVAPGEGD
jgi:anaerobic selenocysteine-containing dehydrogenase